jgi:hypothetical protein
LECYIVLPETSSQNKHPQSPQSEAERLPQRLVWVVVELGKPAMSLFLGAALPPTPESPRILGF